MAHHRMEMYLEPISKPGTAPDQVGELRPFDQFSTTMMQLACLKMMPEARRNRLLIALYQLARAKKTMELICDIENGRLPKLRALRERKMKASQLLSEALVAVKHARESYPDELAECERESSAKYGWGLRPFMFAAIERQLYFSVQMLKAWGAMEAAEVDPKLRTDVEGRLAAEYLEPYDDNAEGTGAHNFPSAGKARSIDTAFIRAAAKCVDKYGRENPVLRGKDKDKIVMRLFEAAFGDTSRDQNSIHKAIQRGKKRPALDYVPAQKAKLFFPNSKFIGQNARSAAGMPAKPKQSRPWAHLLIPFALGSDWVEL